MHQVSSEHILVGEVLSGWPTEHMSPGMTLPGLKKPKKNALSMKYLLILDFESGLL